LFPTASSFTRTGALHVVPPSPDQMSRISGSPFLESGQTT
jgi:hypothetical protein